MGLWIALILCIALSAFFSATETAFSAASRVKLKTIEGDQKPRAQRALELLEKYEVKVCASGHLHAESLRLAFDGWHGHTRHICVSGDKLDFKPCKIL